MAFDQPTRNRLQRFVSEARAVLTDEFTRQLQNEYGLDPASASVTPLEKLQSLDDARYETARILRVTLEHYDKTNPSVSIKDL
ncbi:MAG: BREX-1 system adenine-specific DNA-methyltransferase PglX, partial [Acidobacteria bacterium]|nr:BREX-1 system adenine-specific DNA-methyltransferase PglX [Acidobacteriota bacterium]